MDGLHAYDMAMGSSPAPHYYPFVQRMTIHCLLAPQVSGVEGRTMAVVISQLHHKFGDKAGRWPNQIQSRTQINSRPGE